MKRFLLYFTIMFAALFPVRATSETLHSEVGRLCENKEYEAAINLLQEQLQRKGSSASLFYDLAGVYYRAGNMGGAVLNYERALKLDPHSGEAKNNLRYVSIEVQRMNEALTGDKNLDPTPEESSILKVINDTITSAGSDFWCVAAIISFLLFLSLSVVYLLMRNELVRKWGFFGGAGLLLLSIIFIFFSARSRSVLISEDRAVIMTNEVTLQSTPGDGGKQTASPLVNGTEVQLISKQNDKEGKQWVEVYLNSDYKGWLPADALEVIKVKGLR